VEFSVDGKRVFAATGGRPPKPEMPTVIFVHGAGMDHTVWMLQTRFFAHHGRNVLAIDLPGHGRSEGPALTSIGEMAEWLLRFLDAAGLDKAAVVGHSMGALVSLEAAARAPLRIWALGLLGAAARMPVHPDLLEAARAGEHSAIDLVASWGFGRRAHFGGARAPGQWMMGAGIRLLERAENGLLGVDLGACDAYQTAAEAAGKVTCPVLIVAGAIDRMTSVKGARELAQKFASARVVVIPGAGHMMMVEQPDRTLDALAEIV